MRIPRTKKKRTKVIPGSSPGQIIVSPEAAKPILSVLSYNATTFEERHVISVDDLKELPTDRIHWINIDGLGDADVIRKIGEIFSFHPLALEDVTNVQVQRPKIEEYDESLFLIARMPVFRNGKCISVETEQLSLFLSDNAVITFQETPGGDPFDGIRERLRKAKGKIRTRGGDYLAYTILDAIIDSFFPVIDEKSEEIEAAELEILERPNGTVLQKVHALKQDLIQVRRALWPLREVLNSLIRDSSERVKDETKLFLRDCYDHVAMAIDLIETYRELCSDLTDMYLSNMSNKMNEVMKLLTMITTIFVPLTFIVGVYGMNFDPGSSPYNMPELRSVYGYPAVLLVMLVLTLSFIGFFKRKGWM